MIDELRGSCLVPAVRGAEEGSLGAIDGEEI